MAAFIAHAAQGRLVRRDGRALFRGTATLAWDTTTSVYWDTTTNALGHHDHDNSSSSQYETPRQFVVVSHLSRYRSRCPGAEFLFPPHPIPPRGRRRRLGRPNRPFLPLSSVRDDYEFQTSAPKGGAPCLKSAKE